MSTVLGTDYVDGLLVIVVVAILVLACKLTFSSRGVRNVVARPDYGLLSPAARFDSADSANAARDALADHGIRGTVAPAGKGYDPEGRPWPASAHVVLVFPHDVERAAELVANQRH